VIVHLDVVVLRLLSVNLSLNLVSVVVQDKEVRVHAASKHRADLLQRHSQAAKIHLRRTEQSFALRPSPWRQGMLQDKHPRTSQ